MAAGTASYGGKTEPLASGTVRETPDGWCVQTSALTRWFGIGVKPVTSGAVLVLESDAKLPVELAMERQERAKHLRPASFDLKSLPQVRLPYRMWRAPALDFVVSAGVTYRAKDGMRVDRQSSVYAAGEIAALSYDAQLTTTQKGIPSNLRLRAYRSDPDGGLLGPLKATHFGFGDVEGFDSKLTGIGRKRTRRGHHQPPADHPGGVRPHPLRRRSAERLGSRDLPQRRATRLRQVGFQPTLCV